MKKFCTRVHNSVKATEPYSLKWEIVLYVFYYNKK